MKNKNKNFLKNYWQTVLYVVLYIYQITKGDKQMKTKDLKDYLLITILFLSIVAFLVAVEVKVQKNWDLYEQNYFAEMGVNNNVLE